MTSRREIIERIEALYSLSSSTPFENERSSSLALAKKLMKKYCISEKEICKTRYRDGTSKQTKKQEPQDDYRQKHEYRQSYYRDTPKFGKKNIIASIIRSTEKAHLLKMLTTQGVFIDIWMPKSCIYSQSPGIFLVDRFILENNVKSSIPWLRKHHPKFKNTNIPIEVL